MAKDYKLIETGTFVFALLSMFIFIAGNTPIFSPFVIVLCFWSVILAGFEDRDKIINKS